MLKCTNKCPHPYTFPYCTLDPKTCGYGVEASEIRKENREISKCFWRLCVIGAVGFLALLFALMVVIGNQNAEKIRDTDILNQQNAMLLELDKQSIDGTAENRSEVNLESLTGEAREIVERVVAAEARGEDLQGMMAVAQVIKDRSDLWDMHPVDVVFAEGQFAKPYEGEISDEIHLAVANVFDGGVRVFEEPTTHFYSGEEPYWADEKVNRGSVGCHRFLY